MAIVQREEVHARLATHVQGLSGGFFAGPRVVFEKEVDFRDLGAVRGILPDHIDAFRFADKIIVTVAGQKFTMNEVHNPSGLYFIDARLMTPAEIAQEGGAVAAGRMMRNGIDKIVVTRSGVKLGYNDEKDGIVLSSQLRD